MQPHRSSRARALAMSGQAVLLASLLTITSCGDQSSQAAAPERASAAGGNGFQVGAAPTGQGTQAGGMQSLDIAGDLRSDVFVDDSTYYRQSLRLSWSPARRNGSEQRIVWGENHHVGEHGTLSEPLPPDAHEYIVRDFNGPELFWYVLTRQDNRWLSSDVMIVPAPEIRYIRGSQSLAAGPPAPPEGAPSCMPIIEDISPDQSNTDPADPDGASSGRINGLGVVQGNNNILYAASEWGGLFRSVDAGLNWDRLTSHVPTVCWDVEVDPTNSQTLYVSSFYDGRVDSQAGFQVSYNGGTTFNKPASATPDNSGTGTDNTPQVGYFCTQGQIDEPSGFGICVRQDAPQNVYIGTNCGLAISSDSGASWIFVDPTQTSARRVTDVVVGPDGIIHCVDQTGYYNSIDGGITWSASTLPFGVGGRSIAQSPDEVYVLIVAGTDNNLYESNDGGATWTNIAACDPQNGGGRIPFVVTNDTTAGFDVWTGGVTLWRIACTSGAAPGGAARVPAFNQGVTWFGGFSRSGLGAGTGAHDDVGDIVFDSEVNIDAPPVLFSNDGGLYYAATTSAAPTGIANLVFEQPDRTPHAAWLYGMSGTARNGNEDLQYGCQDIGGFANINAGAANPVPNWNNWNCCDCFDCASEDDTALMSYGFFSAGRGFRMWLSNPGFAGGGEINTYPAGGLLPSFNFAEGIDDWGDDAYVMLTQDCVAVDNDMNGQSDNGCPGLAMGGSDGGVFITTDITANPIVWTELGNATEPPSNALVEVQAARFPDTTPVFYVTSGGGNARSADSLWRFIGTNPAGAWTRIDTNIPGAFGVSIFAVHPTNGNLLYAAALTAGGPAMFRSDDAGMTWTADTGLDNFMAGFGLFRYQTGQGPTEFTGFGGYPQPSLLAFDPANEDNIVAGGRDTGVFLSRDGGASWRTLTDPFTPDISGTPHIARPFFAQFDEDFSTDMLTVIIGTHGMGVWRITVGEDQPGLQIPGPLTFPDTCVGDTAIQTLNVCNTGTCPLEINGITSSNPAFVVDNRTGGFPVAIQPGSCFPFQVRFIPTGNLNYVGTLTVETNDPSNPSVVVPVDGVGLVQDLATVMSDNGNFGNVCLGDFRDLNLSVMNSGDCVLTLNNIVSDNPEFEVATVMNFPVGIARGTRLQIPIRFEPNMANGYGARAGTLTIFTDDPDTPQKQVPVSGFVPSGDINVVGNGEFGIVCPDEVAERTFSVCNTGLCNLNVISASVDCADFTIVANRFPDAISHDFCLDLIVRYTPQTVGTHNCNLTIVSDDPDENPVVIPLSGTTPETIIDVPDPLTFPPTVIQEIDPTCESYHPFAITNLGLCNAQILDVVVEEDPNYLDANWTAFQLENVPNLPLTLQPGHRVGNGQARIVFRPEAVAHRIRARVAITYVDNDPNIGDTETVYVELCGEGVRTGARVLGVNPNGVPLPVIDKITLWKYDDDGTGINTIEVVFDKTPFFLPADPPCPEILYHWGWGTELNPNITLVPGTYLAELAVYGLSDVRTVEFTIEDECDFIDTLEVVFPTAP